MGDRNGEILAETLSKRGGRAIRPVAEYIKTLLDGMNDTYHPETNPNGHVIMSVAENRQNFDMMREHLRNCREIDNTASAYTKMTGMPPFRQAFAKLMEHILPCKRSLDPENFCMSTGCTPLIENLSFLLTDAGDSILIPSPYYPAFDNDCCIKAGAVVQPVPLDTDPGKNHYPLTVELLEEQCQAAERAGRPAKAVIVSNPENPTADVHPPEEIKKVVEWCTRNKIHLVCDEIYAKSVFNPDPEIPFESVVNIFNSLGDYVHVLWGLSKDFGMSGYRVGALYTENKEIIQALNNVNCFCTISNDVQQCLTQAFQDLDFIDRYLERNRNVLKEHFESIRTVLEQAGIPYMRPRAGLFFWMDLRKLLREESWEAEKELRSYLETKLKILFTPGQPCHPSCPGFFRACIAWSDKASVEEAFRRLSHYYSSHAQNA